MSIATIDRSAAPAPAHMPAPDTPQSTPRLLAGTELIGRVAGSGLREPPYLARRRDGQVVQVSQLLYVIASQMDGRALAAIATDAGQRMDLRITPDQVAYVAEHKLAPLGLIAPRDGTPRT
jgi:putative peptide zinc metalloprotease protein